MGIPLTDDQLKTADAQNFFALKDDSPEAKPFIVGEKLSGDVSQGPTPSFGRLLANPLPCKGSGELEMTSDASGLRFGGFANA